MWSCISGGRFGRMDLTCWFLPKVRLWFDAGCRSPFKPDEDGLGLVGVELTSYAVVRFRSFHPCNPVTQGISGALGPRLCFQLHVRRGVFTP